MYRYTTISFPALGIEIDPIRAFSVGPLTVHLYGLIIACGLVLAVCYAMRRSRRFGLNDDLILDGVIWVTPFAIACARLYYCAFEWQNYADDPISVLYIWEGGLAIYGGVIGAVIGVCVFCRIKGISLGATVDLVSLGFLIGQSIGRWGNFFNREAFGGETDSLLRMGLYSPRTGLTTYHHPTFLYESLWNAAGFVLLHHLSGRRRYDGQIALGYAAWYGLGRCMIEGLRTDSLYIPGTAIRVSQLLAAVSFAAALAVLLYQAGKPHSPERLYVNRVGEEINDQSGGTEHE